MDYVYIEEPLVAGFDPGINLSGWNWKQGLSFYQSFGHESVQLFIRHLPRGHYSIEYELGVVREGTFVHPATVIQSYFVPEIGGYRSEERRVGKEWRAGRARDEDRKQTARSETVSSGRTSG